MTIKTAEFIASYPDLNSCPPSDLPDYAFIGRSNVGKSSILNMLTERKALAKVSGRPGKTQLINQFLINREWIISDLPGYGWAQVSKTMRQKFTKMIETFLLLRTNLSCVFLLIDIRHGLQQNDDEFMEWLGINRIPFVIVFTKADKMGKTAQNEAVEKYRIALSEKWEDMPQYFITSSVSRAGREEVLDFIEKINTQISVEKGDNDF